VTSELRRTFDEAAELYDRARPTYPDALFDDLVELAGLEPGSRVLEIGCGTGEATVALAEHGLHVTCVELGSSLADVTRRNLAGFPAVRVITDDFETWQPADADYDAVAAFTAFHWIAHETRYAKTAAILHRGGALAVVAVNHVLPEDGDPFFRDVQADYEGILPGDAPSPPEAVAGLRKEIEASGLFRAVGERRYRWDVAYTADQYLDVLATYSGHRALDERSRARLFELIRARIGDRTVRKTYLATLDVALRI
jgi:ubiquinone/menaquinone biosynthesis C-methylase UbiE